MSFENGQVKQLVENKDGDGGGDSGAGGVGGGAGGVSGGPGGDVAIGVSVGNAIAKLQYVRETCAQGTCPLSHFHKRR